MPIDYEEAGVSTKKGDDFADFIKNFPSKAVSKGIGGFAGGIPIDPGKYSRPILMSTTDGVGTKLLVAKKLGKYDTVGIDLVAMNVNDLIVAGCEPLSFLDYIACGRIDDAVLREVMTGIVAGCEEAECVLTGGETAEMPGMYAEDDIDLAGFALGVVDEKDVLPKLSSISAGDSIVGLPSSGVHSNGFSLARKAVDPDDLPVWRELLTPTRIYVREMKKLISSGMVLAAAHITGSGLIDNFVRVIPKGLAPKFAWDWEVPRIFGAIQASGGISTEEMRKVFNMGIGMAIVVKRKDEAAFLDFAARNGIAAFVAGELVRG
jgi:phosphoribosylformylglycinamidine cyclo-ligase